MDKKADIHEPPAGTKCDCGNNEFTRDNRYDRWYCGLCRMVFLSESDKNPKMDKKAETPETQFEPVEVLNHRIAIGIVESLRLMDRMDKVKVVESVLNGTWEALVKRMFTREDMQKAWDSGERYGYQSTVRVPEEPPFDQFMEDNYPEKPKD